MSVNKTTTLLALVLAIFFTFPSATAAVPAADHMLKSAANILSGGKSATATYTVKANRETETGKIQLTAKAFAIDATNYRTWFDGTTMWSYNAADNEVTISSPTAAEVTGMNPYSLVSTYATQYNAKTVSSTIKGTYAVQLTPKSAQSPVKQVIVCLKSTDYSPVRIDITARNGQKSTIIISNMTVVPALPKSTFVFPKAKYPGVSITDMR